MNLIRVKRERVLTDEVRVIVVEYESLKATIREIGWVRYCWEGNF